MNWINQLIIIILLLIIKVLISVDEGDGLETITGSKQTEDKIDIIYTIIENPEYTKLMNP